MMRQKISTLPLGATALLLSLFSILISTGCSTYKLGRASKLPFEKIFVKPAGNRSYAPQAQALLSAQLRQNIIRDSRVKLVAKIENADAVLTVDIIKYDRTPAARSRADTVEARDFDLTLVTSTSLYDQESQNFFFENRKVSQHTNALSENPYATSASEQHGLLQAEYDAMPRLTRDLARKIADEVLSTW